MKRLLIWGVLGFGVGRFISAVMLQQTLTAIVAVVGCVCIVIGLRISYREENNFE